MTTKSATCECSFCGIREHIYLLDIILEDGYETGQLGCIRCHPNWNRTVGPELFKLSVAPELKPYYDEWARKQ